MNRASPAPPARPVRIGGHPPAASRSPQSPHLRAIAVTVGLLLVAFALRTAALGHKSLWLDEADSVFFAAHSWRDLLWNLCDPHPPVYYALLKAAMSVAGRSEFVVRLPSVLAGVLSVATLARFTRELGTLRRRSGLFQRAAKLEPGSPLLPAALLALSPLHVWYSQEARMYALVILLTLGAAVAAVRLIRSRGVAARGRPAPSVVRAGVSYLLLASAALLTDQSAAIALAIVMLGCALTWASERAWRTVVAWLGLQLIPACAVVGWFRISSFAGAFGPVARYPLTMLKVSAERLLRGVASPGPAAAIVIGTTVTAALGLRLIKVHTAGQRAGGISAVGTARSPASGMPAGTVLAVYVLGAALSVVPRLYTVKRLAVGVLPYALLVVSWAVSVCLRRRRGRVLILAIPLALSIVGIAAVPKTPWDTGVAGLQEEIAPGDTVWVDELVVPVYDYYGDQAEHTVLAVRTMHRTTADPPADGRLWFVAHDGRYRNILDFLPGLEDVAPLQLHTWPGIEARAYDAATLSAEILAPRIPEWALTWPSPIAEACAGGQP